MAGVLNVGKGYNKVLAAGMGGLGAVIGMLLLTGKLFAAFPLAGIGGFVISAPGISGTNFTLTPSLTATDQQGGWPASLIKMDTVSIPKDFELTKQFDLSATPIGALIPTANLNILASSLTGNGLQLDSTGLQASDAKFTAFAASEQDAVVPSGTVTKTVYGIGNQAIQLKAPSNGPFIDPTLQLGLQAASVNLTGAAINTDALVTQSLDLSNLKLAIVANVVGKDSSGNPTSTPYGDFQYDSTYDTQDNTYNAASTTQAPNPGTIPGN